MDFTRLMLMREMVSIIIHLCSGTVWYLTLHVAMHGSNVIELDLRADGLCSMLTLVKKILFKDAS